MTNGKLVAKCSGVLIMEGRTCHYKQPNLVHFAFDSIRAQDTSLVVKIVVIARHHAIIDV